MMNKTILLAAVAAALTSSLTTAQGPDVIAFRIGFNGGNSNDLHYYGQNGGIAAYSFATQSCNVGSSSLSWNSGGTSHPVISQNMFRLKDGRFEQLGQSWLKHGFCALCEGGCGNGSGSGCASQLFVGCADTYWATLNDGGGGGPKYTVNPVSGSHTHPDPSPSGNNTIRGRLQCAVSDMDPSQNPNAEYLIEGGYMAADDAANGNSGNNMSWRLINVLSVSNLSGGGPTNAGETALHGWRNLDPSVTLVGMTNANEGGSGRHGYFYVGYTATDNGDGTFDYSYAVENLNSTQGAVSFEIPAGAVSLSNVWFNDVLYHSGEVQDNTDWVMTQPAGGIKFSCTQTFAVNPNANALNWATVYSFGFTTNAAPVAGTGVLTLFEPGTGSLLTAPIEGPGTPGPSTGVAFCFGDGSGTTCPCNNHGSAGQGCQNSTGSGATLSASGSNSVSGDTVVLGVTGAVSGQPGLFFQGNNAVNAGLGNAFGDGLRCAGNSTIRLQVGFVDGAGTTVTSIGIASKGAVSAGQTKRYQFGYRDPVFSPCLNGFNLSNAVEIVWGM
jgi:hypothetical protein